MVAGSNAPGNTTNGSYAFGGSRQKITETTFALAPVQMGARVYLPTIGRFTSIDPIQGGTPNNYVYPPDPINDSDYTGQFGWSSIKKIVRSANAYVHYLVGAGKKVTKAFSSFSWNKKQIVTQAINGSDASRYRGQNGSYGVGPIPNKIVPKPVSAQPTSIADKAVIGRIYVQVSGTLTVKGSGWTFKGTITPVSNDIYDFNADGSRSTVAALSTGVGAFGGWLANKESLGIIKATSYDLLLEGGVDVTASGTF